MDVADNVENESLLLDKLRVLVRDRTRFDPADIEQLACSEHQQAFRLKAGYKLEAGVKNGVIDGFFSPQTKETESADPARTALESMGDRSKRAVHKLVASLKEQPSSHQHIAAGVFLAADDVFWALSRCGGCRGSGNVTCPSCSGDTRVTCPKCSGACKVSCSSCYGSGNTTCYSCNGSGSVSESVPYTVSATVWVNNMSQTEYRTEYKTVYRPCTGFNCRGGRVTCSGCGGMGKVSCSNCNAVGKVMCSRCTGLGSITCFACAGSGRTGSSAWVDVSVEPAYAIDFPAGALPESDAVLSKVGVHGVAGFASQFALSESSIRHGESADTVKADYEGALKLHRLKVRCNQTEYDVSAYGEDHKWLSLDDIVQDLLLGDLRALKEALSDAADHGFFSSRIDHLIDPLKNVTSSELNAEIVESALGQAGAPSYDEIVTAEYARDVEKAILGSLRQVYTRLAKRYWWRSLALSALVSAGTWAFTSGVIAAGAGLVTAGFFLVGFIWKVRRVLESGFGNKVQAKRAMKMASKSKRNQVAYLFMTLPALGIAVASAALLPPSPHLWNRIAPLLAEPAAPVLENTTDEVPAAAPVRTDGQATLPTADARFDRAVEAYRGYQLAQARELFKDLASEGHAASYGPYGWMVMRGEGLPPRTASAAAREAEARPWIDKALALNDPWAKAAQGFLLANVPEAPELQKGLSLLNAAAAEGHTGAMNQLGLLYILGFNVAPNEVEARKWFSMAADGGSAVDIYNVGLLDWNGQGGKPVDRKAAMRRWKQAAEMGEERAIWAVKHGRPND